MQLVLSKIQALQGVQGACIYRNTQLLAATPLPIQLDKVNQVIPALDQLFNDLEAKHRDYNELCITLSNHLIVVYKLQNHYMLLVITEKRVHLPMVQMGIKAAIRHLGFEVST
ncbi:MAG: hypothetical protein WAQ53_02795 [Thiofilum sp.]|uniref:hypothetical protein n=1 Tax=Thiofilum sp. TaxID=2212733 RepID=UPI0025CD9798|nr:hypothetical protein [Thiofilum sp.]MBK8454616.1 hypothetical protein [Thiofilum sp.]